MGSLKTIPALSILLALFFLLGTVRGVDAQALVSISVSPPRFEFAAWPGERLSGTIRVANLTGEMLPVVMEVEDFVPRGEEGRVAVGPGNEAYSLKDWIHFDLEEFTVFPEKQVAVDFAVDLPTDAEPGSRFGAILARTTAEPVGPGPRVVTKIGSLVLVDVYGEVREELSVVEFQAPRFDLALPLPLAVRFANSGTVHVKPQGMISVYNVFGNLVATTTLPARNVLPGAVRRVEVPISDGLLAGRYTARLQGTYGRQNEIPITAEQSFWFVDWRNVGLPSLILLGVVGFVVWKRRNFRAAFRVLRTGEEAERNVQVAEGKPIRARGEERSEGRKPRRMDL